MIFVCLSNVVFAQPGAIDTTFNPTDLGFGFGGGASSTVYTSSIQSDGKIIIAGDFTSYNGTSINRIARLNADGTLDATFNVGTGASDYVWSSSIQSDGKIIIGDGFTSYNGTASNYIARLNADGTLDATFNVGTGANSYVYTSSIQNDGKVIVWDVVKNTPFANAGITSGIELLAIDYESVTGKSFEEISNLLMKTKGSKCKLQIRNKKNEISEVEVVY